MSSTSEPTGDEILDDALAALVEAGGDSGTSPAIERISFTTSGAIERITSNAHLYRDIALKRLVEKGVLREEEGRFLWVFHTRRYPVIDDTEQREVRARLRQLILTDEIPDPRDVVLLCLIDACGLLGLVLSLDEIAASAAADRAADPPRPDRSGDDEGGRRNPLYHPIRDRPDPLIQSFGDLRARLSPRH